MTTDVALNYRVNSIRKALYFVELYIRYFVVFIRLRRYGLKKTVDLCTELSHSKDTGMADGEFVALTRSLTESVLKWHLMPNKCVPDSLLPCWFLARRGIKAEFVIIVRQFPFMAHAQAYWNEMPLTDPPPEWSLPGKFVTLMRK